MTAIMIYSHRYFDKLVRTDTDFMNLGTTTCKLTLYEFLFRFALDTLPVNAVLMRFPTLVLKIRGELRTA